MAQAEQLLEGWLFKRKSSEAFALFAKDNKRWFKINKVQGADSSELALCYYNSPKDKDPKGWIYLADITEISDDGKSFKIVSASRSMVLEAGTNSETKLWLNGIIELCPRANIDKVTSPALPKRNPPKKENQPRDEDKKQTRDDKDSSMDRPITSSPAQSATKHSKEDHRAESKTNANNAHMNNTSNSLRNNVSSDEDVDRGDRQPNHAQAKEVVASHRVSNNRSRIPRSDTTMYSSAGSSAEKNSKANSKYLYDGEEDDSDHEIQNSKPNFNKKPAPRPNPAPRDDAWTRETSDDEEVDIQHRKLVNSNTEKAIDEISPPVTEQTKKPTAAPSAPPPRRAKDALQETSGQVRQRKTVEDMIRTSSRNIDLSDDEKEVIKKKDPMEGLASMANAFRAHLGSSNLPEGTKTYHNRSRQSSDPNIPVDKNFASENWDDDEDVPVRRSKINGNKNGPGSSVQADTNWLEDDFDN